MIAGRNTLRPSMICHSRRRRERRRRPSAPSPIPCPNIECEYAKSKKRLNTVLARSQKLSGRLSHVCAVPGLLTRRCWRASMWPPRARAQTTQLRSLNEQQVDSPVSNGPESRTTGAYQDRVFTPPGTPVPDDRSPRSHHQHVAAVIPLSRLPSPGTRRGAVRAIYPSRERSA